jgi:signal peptidase I
MRKAWWCGWIVGTACAVMLLLGAGWWFMQGGRVYGVQTGSMAPTFAPGEAVLVRPVPADTLRVGDIVAYRNAKQPSLIVSHRIVAKNVRAGTFLTQGDHNHQSDNPITTTQIIGKITARAPGLGRIAAWLRKPAVAIIGLYMPVAVVVASELRRWYYQVSHVSYSLRGH